MGRALTLKYRPTDFDTICGQKTIAEILSRAVATKSLKNAILLAGPSGCGKTSIARIIANKINDGIGAPIEIDAASNSGVDNVRAIIAEASQRSLTSEYKVYIIDECQAITSAGWQAFLKGIEEPSAYTIFIFCTTEPNKIPNTILNRVQRYNLAKIPSAEINARLQLICQNEGFTNYQDACDFISKLANGGMRDAITYLEQCAEYSTDLNMENVKTVLGDISAETMLRLTIYIRDGHEDKVISTVKALQDKGQDLKDFLDNYISFILDLKKYLLFNDLSLTAIPAYLNTVENPVVNFVVNFDKNSAWFSQVLETLLNLKVLIKYDASYADTILIYLLKLCRR